ncbi:MAG: hypothetical protein LC797_19140, partial [Chloroflexi bacterium]|nr:hypothetical protein [Chloroflexota bacterium]
MRRVLLAALVAMALLLAGEVSVALLPVRVSIELRDADGVVDMDGSQHLVTVPNRPAEARIRLEQPGPVQREYQIDGSDTTTRQDLDPMQFRSAEDAGWYRAMAWLRDEASYSRWEDVRLVDLADGRVLAQGRAAVEASALPAAFRIDAALRRPESPATIWIEALDSTSRGGLMIDRDHHRVRWLIGPDADEAVTWFFPEDPWPFAAELTHLLGRTAAGGIGLLGLIGLFGLGAERARRWLPPGRVRRRARRLSSAFTAAIVLGAWLTAAVWIAVRVYHQLPHIVDAEAYYFQARILETGRTWLQPPD